MLGDLENLLGSFGRSGGFFERFENIVGTYLPRFDTLETLVSDADKRLAALDAKQKEILRQKKERIAAIEKAKLRLAQLHGDIAKKKEQLRNGAPRDRNCVDHPRYQSSLCKQFPNEDQDKDYHQNLFETPNKRQDETYAINDGGFLQLKTPGVFYGEKEDRPRVKDPIKKKARSALPVTTSWRDLRDSKILSRIRSERRSR